ncbi:hypothetical protein ACX0G9_17940 [Flavitalea flava]
MLIINRLPKKGWGVIPLPVLLFVSFSFSFFISFQSFAQKPAALELEKMPVDLETDFALSALPPHLRDSATVYLMDPARGYYIARQGSNGFICYIVRTEWQWNESRQDLASPISFDAEGARAIFPVDRDVAAMRASGKYSALQIRDSITDGFRKGRYNAPARAGISYMLAPLMRTHPGGTDNFDVVTMHMPHYMFYAPHVTNADVGTTPGHGPMLLNEGPHGYLILSANEKEKAKILADGEGLLKRLIAYKAYFKVEPEMHH